MNRNEVNLSDETIEVLTELAAKDNRKLKNYLEKVLTNHVERHNRLLRLKKQKIRTQRKSLPSV